MQVNITTAYCIWFVAFNNGVRWILSIYNLFLLTVHRRRQLNFDTIWLVDIFIMDLASENNRSFPHRLGIVMPPPYEEWWKGHIVLPLTVRPSLSASGVSNLRFSFFFRRGHPCSLDTFLILSENDCFWVVVYVYSGGFGFSLTFNIFGARNIDNLSPK